MIQPTDALKRLRRWQAVTIALVLVAIAGEAAGRLWPRPVPAAPALDREAVLAVVREALEKRPDPAAPLAARVDRLDEAEKALRARVDELAKALEARPEAPSSAGPERPPAAVPVAPVRVVPLESRFLCRLRLGAAGGLEWRALPLGGPEAGPFPSGDEAAIAGGPWTSLPAGEHLVRIAVPRPSEGLEPGVLFASAIVRAEKDVGEDQGAPNKLYLACVGPSGARRLWDLAGQFTPARGATRDALLKVSANTAAFAVGPDSRLEIVLDAEALTRRLAGALDIYVRQGPLIAVPEGEKKP